MTTEKNNHKRKQVMRYTALGTQMLVILAIGVFGGLKLDALLHTSPLLIIVLPAAALALSLVYLYRQLVGKK